MAKMVAFDGSDTGSISIKKRLWLHPGLVTIGMWLLCYGLYEMRLSSRLWLQTPLLLQVVLVIIGGLFFGVFTSLVLPYKRRLELHFPSPSQRTERSAWSAFLFLNIVLVVEIVYSGFVPIFSKIASSGISHFAFGIPTVHGFVFAGYLFFTSCGVIAYMLYGRWRYLIPLITAVFVGILIVNRKLYMVAVLQSVVLIFMLSRRAAFAFIVSSFIGGFTLMAFGVVGDLRSGSVIDDNGGFRSNGIMQKVPGMDWAYLYLTTPLHNLAYATDFFLPSNNAIPLRTIAPLLPTVLDPTETERGEERFRSAGKNRYWVESEMFNVSTAFINPLLDLGLVGVFAYAFLTAGITSVAYLSAKSWLGVIICVTLYAASVLTVFSDSYMNLNVIGQLLWIFVVFALSRMRLGASDRVTMRWVDKHE